ncbi:MAG: Hsp20/alpha crystallin family protein [Deltaproteobacteria bacterium]|nr:Hsp20/alpha crystallin family protein [Deltaproteobacteria bacterium]
MKTLQTYKPLRDLFNLSTDLDRFLWGTQSYLEDAEGASASWVPSVDIFEDQESVKLHAELPGLKREDVKIQVKQNVLTLRGERKFESEKKKDNYHRIERRYGLFTRSFTLPNSVDESKIKASMKDGILEILIPKKPEAVEKEVSIEVQ